MKAVHAFVSGRVQGVFFRQSARQAARGLNLVGWVRNLPDRRVEVWAQGETHAVDRFVDWLWQGPAEADVAGVESDIVALEEGLSDFRIVS